MSETDKESPFRRYPRTDDSRWKEPGARAVPWSDKPCLCKDAIGNSSLRHCPACMEVANGTD